MRDFKSSADEFSIGGVADGSWSAFRYFLEVHINFVKKISSIPL